MIDSLSKPFALFFHHYYSLLRFLKNNNNKTITILPIMRGIIITFLYMYLWWVTYHSQRSGINKFLSCITRMCYTVKCCSEISQCQAFSQCRQAKKADKERKTSNKKWRKGRWGEPVSIFLNTSVSPLWCTLATSRKNHFQALLPYLSSTPMLVSCNFFPTSFMRLYFKYIYM